MTIITWLILPVRQTTVASAVRMNKEEEKAIHKTLFRKISKKKKAKTHPLSLGGCADCVDSGLLVRGVSAVCGRPRGCRCRLLPFGFVLFNQVLLLPDGAILGGHLALNGTTMIVRRGAKIEGGFWADNYNIYV